MFIYVYIYIFIWYIYIYIYIKQMPTLIVCTKIYGQNKHTIYLKAQIFIFFSEALSMWKQITNKNADNSTTW